MANTDVQIQTCVPVQVQDVDMIALFDTGCTITLLDDNWLSKTVPLAIAETKTDITSLSGHNLEITCCVYVNIRLGPAKVKQ